MQYAMIGDIHSSKKDLVKVIEHIACQAPEAELIGTGDLYECTVSKRDIGKRKYHKLEEVMLLPEGFAELVTFPSVIGNQEERILLLTETSEEHFKTTIAALPEKMQVGEAEVIHGHQWEWGGNPWRLLEVHTNHPVVFYGHSHNSILTIDGVQQSIEFGIPYSLAGDVVLVNVGAVVGNREWALYDSERNIVTFMKADQT